MSKISYFEPEIVSLSLVSLTINENGTTTLSGEIVDPGTLDTFTLDVVLQTWSSNISTAQNSGGSAVMYAPDKIMKAGGGFWDCTGDSHGSRTAYWINPALPVFVPWQNMGVSGLMN